ncbi:MAG: DUF1624 domain-containing protein [Planctomycetia bacterium]|nr:DUF1624 domain-containing protein [Planctomycetia bacterium]
MKPATTAARQPSIDILRAVAIVLMVIVHFAENLSGTYGSDGGTFLGAYRYWWLPTGFAAPLFTFLSGVSYRLWADARERRGRDDEATSKATVRRGLFLILLGLAFNVLVWLPEDIFNWDILTLIGTSLIVLDLVRRLPSVVPLLACGVILALAPVLRLIAGYADFWSNGYFDYELTLGDVVLGYLATGYFPLFPWILFPLTGFLAAPLIFTAADGSRRTRPALIGAALVLASAATVLVRPLLPAGLVTTPKAWMMFPASTSYVLGTLGGAILAATFLHRTVDLRMTGRADDRHPRLLDWAGALSRHSLSIYLLHHVVHIWPLWLAGLATTGEPTALWQNVVPASVAVGLAFVFLAAATAVFLRIDRSNALTPESILRWLCD